MKIDKDILIVGAGPTGIGATWRIQEINRKRLIGNPVTWLLIEKSGVPGGMSVSERDSLGFTWDIGSHVIYSRYKYFDRWLVETAGDELLYHERKGWVWIKDKFIPYPIQQNLHYLPAEDIFMCIKDALDCMERNLDMPGIVPTNFAEWSEANFGTTLNNLFFRPYNYKMWGFPMETMSIDWTARSSGSRYANVPKLDLVRLMENILLGRASPTQIVSDRFPYPRSGGAAMLWQRAFDSFPKENKMLNEYLLSIDTKKHIATLASGLDIQYGSLVSTIPLNSLIGICDEDFKSTLPEFKLKHTSVNVIGLGFRGKLPLSLVDKFWIHVADPTMPFFRITVLSNYSQDNVPQNEPHWSLLCEVSESVNKRIDQTVLLADVENALQKGFIPEGETIVSRWVRRVEYAYPLPCLERDAYLEEVEPKFHNRNIYCRGRFGGWKYEGGNQDSSFMQGVEATDNILFSTEELSYFHPYLIGKSLIDRTI